MTRRQGNPPEGDFFAAPARSPDLLQGALATAAGRPVHLKVTKNRSTMVSLTSPGDDTPHDLRLHQAFLAAPDAVLEALGRYLRRRRRADWQVVADFAQTITVSEPPRRTRSLCGRGKVYDLDVLAGDVNQRFFRGRLKVKVGWAPARARPRRAARRRSIRYGSYHRDANEIRIHPLLDDARVPRAFIEYILYHEMLHVVVPPERRNGRWSYHPPVFRHLDRRFPDWPRMQALGKALLDELG
jgi:hypothetical protein